MVRKILVKYIINPFVWKYVKKSDRFAVYNSVKRKQWRKLDLNIEEQKRKLYNIINYSNKNVPYYNNLFKKHNIKYHEDTIFEDIKKIPVLNKDDLRRNFDLLTSKSFKGDFLRNTSGGSTGEPVVFLQDKNYRDWNAAGKLLFYNFAGYNEGDLIIKLWGSEKDVLEGTEGINGFYVRNFMNVLSLNSFKMSKENLYTYVDIINKNKPKIIEAYVQSIYELAKFIEDNNLKVFSPRGIISSAGILYPYMREKIESVFQTRVYNRYGSREVGDIACSCEKSSQLHLNMLFNYVEILNKNGKPVKEGELGYIHVTNLENKVMPMIRYRIGDMGVMSSGKKCLCGRNLLRLEKVEGREMDMFVTKELKLIPGEFFIHFVGVVHNKDYIKKFQVIQKKYDLIKIIYVPKNKKELENNKVNIESSIKKVMGNDCKVIWKEVKNIPNMKNGKYRYTICEIK